MKITDVIPFLTVTVRKNKDEQINNACAIMGISITGNQTAYFHVHNYKKKKDEKSIDIIAINKQTNKIKWNTNKCSQLRGSLHVY